MPENMELITPIEFIRDGYKEKIEKGECVVWCYGSRVEWVELGHELGYGCYRICSWIGNTGDSPLLARRRAYELAMIVEPIDLGVFRQRLHDIVDKISDFNLLNAIEEIEGWEEGAEWWREFYD